MADAYKLKADASFPRVVRVAETVNGETVEETEGVNYAAGDYVLAENLSPRDRDRAESGDLDHLLEGVSREEAENALRFGGDYGTFIPEHGNEEYILNEYGHQTVPRDQVLELKSAGAEAAKSAFEAAHENGAGERPGLTTPDIPSLVEASNEGKSVVPSDSEHVAEEELVGVEQPPGIQVGKEAAAAEGAEEQPQKRSRPTRSEKKETAQEKKGE